MTEKPMFYSAYFGSFSNPFRFQCAVELLSFRYFAYIQFLCFMDERMPEVIQDF